MVNLSEYAAPVRRSIMTRDLILGVSAPAFYILIFVSWVILYNIGKPIFFLITLALYIVARILTRKDVYLVEILLESLLLPDKLHV